MNQNIILLEEKIELIQEAIDESYFPVEWVSKIDGKALEERMRYNDKKMMAKGYDVIRSEGQLGKEAMATLAKRYGLKRWLANLGAGGLMGGLIGSAAGIQSGLDKTRSKKDVLKSTLVGTGAGAAAGIGLGTVAVLSSKFEIVKIGSRLAIMEYDRRAVLGFRMIYQMKRTGKIKLVFIEPSRSLVKGVVVH